MEKAVLQIVNNGTPWGGRVFCAPDTACLNAMLGEFYIGLPVGWSACVVPSEADIVDAPAPLEEPPCLE